MATIQEIHPQSFPSPQLSELSDLTSRQHFPILGGSLPFWGDHLAVFLLNCPHNQLLFPQTFCTDQLTPHRLHWGADSSAHREPEVHSNTPPLMLRVDRPCVLLFAFLLDLYCFLEQ